MKVNKIIPTFKEIFYKDENNNIVLNIFWNSLYIAFFLMPLGISFPTPFFIISIILGCINIFKSKKKFIYDNKALFLFPIYFVVMSLSLIYTSNLSDGIALIQRSLSLLLFPIIFLFVKEDALTVRKLFDFLLAGLIVSFFINLSIAGYNLFSLLKDNLSFNNPNEQNLFLEEFYNGWNYFIETEFSKLISPSYVSVYILLVLSYYLKKQLESKKEFVLVVILFIYLFLLTSIAAYLILMIMCLLLIFKITDKQKKYTMFIMFFLGIIVFLNNPHIFNFYNETSDSEIKKEESNETTSEKLRLLSWKTSIELIKEAPILGYGVGDANDAMQEKYKELGYLDNYNKQYNAHNQFFQTWLQTGIVGIGLLVYIFILLAVRMRRSPNEFSVFLILFISLLFESMLVRFNGIIFFSIIAPLLLKKRSILSSRIIRNDDLLKSEF